MNLREKKSLIDKLLRFYLNYSGVKLMNISNKIDWT